MRHDLFERLRALRLPIGEFAVFGSGPLVVRGVIEASNDLDDGRLTFGTRWAIGDVDPDELIDTAEIIDGLPFARLEHVIAYKRLSGRPKDLDHLAALARSADDRTTRSSR